eukprot:CAMPEP_0115621200 /NCGR_PEP_ID=MMETSP0272-20121206/25605_1 /TAXON_ID=71861 /ORGANISM="Scrippsiella trochoidea, Strain CCMP3099" /LENGTH=303 /DNA_ID=CAMNT_0003057315 /DNA_START=50 /DNA_END=961 /DNA_ORIENTATION=-
MARLRSCRAAACLSAGLVLCFFGPDFKTFTLTQTSAHQSLPLPRSSLRPGHGASSDVPRGDGGFAEHSGLRSLRGLVASVAVAGLCARGLRIAMRSGSASFGQHFMPSLKNAKRKRYTRPKKHPGSWDAMRQPRRYELYDILEELDETTPWYTIVSEPEEPMLPVEGVPLKERYPWAGDLQRVHPDKEEMENSEEDRMAPLFLPLSKAPPPTGRRQRYIERRGFATGKQPPWLNRPEIGYEVHVPHDMPFKKHRQPEPWQMGPKLRQQWKEEQAAKQLAAGGQVADDVEEDDDLDAALDAMDE